MLWVGQLEDTFGYKKWGEKGGTLLSHKLFIEDMFIRKFLKVPPQICLIMFLIVESSCLAWALMLENTLPLWVQECDVNPFLTSLLRGTNKFVE
jgi:sterol desaturase/sphingolipid hydroxylase (fatty acid hydroxylase superfamily)